VSSLRTLDDRYGGVKRQLRSMLHAIGHEEDPQELAKILELQRLLEDGLGEAVRNMRDHGATDADIGAALGVTRAAVSKRWPGGGRYVGAAGRYRKPASDQGLSS
jgi:hypothetical protein